MPCQPLGASGEGVRETLDKSTDVLSPGVLRAYAICIGLFPAAEAIPSGYGLYVVVAAGFLALAPVSRAMWVPAASGADRSEHES